MGNIAGVDDGPGRLCPLAEPLLSGLSTMTLACLFQRSTCAVDLAVVWIDPPASRSGDGVVSRETHRGAALLTPAPPCSAGCGVARILGQDSGAQMVDGGVDAGPLPLAARTPGPGASVVDAEADRCGGLELGLVGDAPVGPAVRTLARLQRAWCL